MRRRQQLSPDRNRDAWATPPIVLTADRYGHLFPRADDGEELAKAERLLLA
jgi:hypothetical protein